VASRQASGRTQAQRRDEAESRILEAATELVAECGFEGLTLAQVGERAGYSRGLPSHYFPTKDKLLMVLCRYIVQSYDFRLKMRTGHGDGYEVFIATLRNYFSMIVEDPVKARAFHTVLTAAYHTPSIVETVAKLNQNTRAAIVHGLRAGIATGQVRPDIDLDRYAVQALGVLRGLVAQWLIDPDAIDLERIGEGFVVDLQQNLAASSEIPPQVAEVRPAISTRSRSSKNTRDTNK
jgi:AcrR family transcriptional regulator